MNYYILKPAVDTPETGSAYPAVESYPDYDFNGPNSVHKLNFTEFPDFAPDIRFKLAKGARLTDMLSQAAISAHGFLISKKLKNALEQFNIVPHKCYPAKIEDHQGNIHNYFWMHLVWEDTSVIDWEESKFYYIHFEEKRPLKLSSIEAYTAKKKELGIFVPIQTAHIKFKKIGYELFVHPFQALSIISNTIKDSFARANLSGISIEPLR
jgi:hypothetical protein